MQMYTGNYNFDKYNAHTHVHVCLYLSEKLTVLHFALRLSLCSLLLDGSADTAWLNTA